MRRIWIILAALLLGGCGVGRGAAETAIEETAVREAEISGEEASEDPSEDPMEDSGSSELRETASPKLLYVYVCGAVQSPGVYSLPEGARAVDALEAAGGFGPEADQSAVNLAALLTDGMQITVPKIGEDTAETGGGKINLNTADAAALETLPGIGPAKAKAVIDYREKNGPFRDCSELTGVPGIGEALYKQIEDRVTVS